MDLLADRTAETLAQWLKEHPGIKVVTRDRSQTYADAIQEGVPEALQIADRWHLLKNLTDAVFKLLQQEYAVIKKQLAPVATKEEVDNSQAELPGAFLVVELNELTPAEQRRRERIECAQQLQRQGWTQKDIAHHLGIHPKTVRRYLRFSTLQAKRQRRGRHLLDPFRAYILKRWNEGCHSAMQMFRETQRQGYAGKITIVRDFVRQLRQASGLPPGVRCQNGEFLDSDSTKRPPSLRQLTWYIIKQPDKRSEENERVLAQMSAGQPKLVATIELARAFAAMVRQQQPEKLDEWLRQANASGYQIWRNFATSLRQDYEAVWAGLRYPWSNDLVAYYTSFAV